MTRLPPDLLSELSPAIERWQDRRVIVIGDALLDEWCYAEPDRLCREAPTPVLSVRHRDEAPGGGGNTAVNLAALGARPVLVAPVGDDPAGARLRDHLRRAGVADRTVTVGGRPTCRKRRVVAAGQVVFREDDGVSRAPLPAAAAGRFAATLDAETAGADGAAVVVCDYGLGAVGDQVRDWLAGNRDRFAFVAVDAHDLEPWAAVRPSLVTPSRAEAAALLGSPVTAGQHGATAEAAATGPGAEVAALTAETAAAGLLARTGADVVALSAETAAAGLLARTGADVVALTLDAGGAAVVAADGRARRTEARPALPGHTVGAGDAYVAALSLALATGTGLPAAAELAQLAAGATVHGPGTCVCSAAALLAEVGCGTVVGDAALPAVVAQHRARGARIVFTNGCFDVLHRGHVGYLAEAKALGDVLVVAVNSDASVRRLKGPQRPVNDLADRMAVLAALACVDHVTAFEEDSPAALIEAVRPDVYVKGGDYPPELIPEAPLVRRLGGEVRTLSYVPDRSTSQLIERIRARPAGDGPRH
jgi:D-beta-D-heptose 7-phosphate kinase/D-beta-D-heptose 1-phosphate adenosyltransferase